MGTGIEEQHDRKGILISKGIGDDKPHIRLNWTQVEKRIKELIRLDRYLNPKEKEIYPQWLEKQEERRAELAEEQRNREILSSAPPKQESVQAAESEPQQEAQYAYHLGDTVYMGADEYEILAFDDKQVRLFDTQFPLFNKEMDRAEFDRRVRENPLNDHLKVKELPSEEKTDKAPAFDIGMGYLGNGLTVWNRAVEENGDYQTIVEGVSASEFAPDDETTREQLVAILYRYAGEPATAANLAGYADGASVGAYAADAMSWCVEHMIITGTTGDTLAPQGTATRAQAAAMLMRFVER